ncbi:MAG: hypothetical protein GY849_24835 [Deltaproteobacteria bacterium]|nr:hypothetical protein [Deltaproteobacteria bacterium]
MMEVFEYYGQISENGHLTVPDELTKRLDPQKKWRVMVFLEDEASDWKDAATRHFFDGYADEDEIYDAL